MRIGEFDLQAVLFDMDGLLLDTEYISRECWRESARALGVEMSDEIFVQFVGLGRENCRRRLHEIYGENFDPDLMFALRRERFNKIIAENGFEVKKGAVNLLKKLKANGIATCVATSTDKARAVELLSTSGIIGLFDEITGGDGVVNGKPHPEIFLKAAAAAGVLPENCLALEDSRLGVESAYRGGIRVIVVPDIAVPDEITIKRAYAVCKDLDEVSELLITADIPSVCS